VSIDVDLKDAKVAGTMPFVLMAPKTDINMEVYEEMRAMQKWYKIEAKDDKAEIWIYETIGEDFWSGEGITAKKFQNELSTIKARYIDLHINSIGGSVIDGTAIYNIIKQHPATVTTHIDGWALSIASVIALAGDRILMAENGLFMIHNPMGGIYGNMNEVRRFADILEKIGSTMIRAYTSKSGKSNSQIQAMLDAETWMNAEEALAAGFIDEISGKLDMAACARFVPVMAKAGFKHIPDVFQAARQMPSERDLERTLRDAGCSVKVAKTILASGYPADLRDGDPLPVDPTVADTQRDVEPTAPARKDRVSELLTKAEMVAPAR
jgi:ATP-dependent Clp protease, protease subunit